MSVLYIGGTGRSGSTVLTRLLGQNPGVAAVGELRYALRRGVVGNQLCGCGEPFRSCPFWIEVYDSALGGMDVDAAKHLITISHHLDRIRFAPVLLADALRTPSFRARLNEYSAYLDALYRSVAEVADAKVVIDSSKDPSHAYVVRSIPTIDLSLLHLVRDSRAVAFSFMRERVRPEVHWKVAFMRKRSPWQSSRSWTENNLLFDVLARSGIPHKRLRYEDFARAPEATITDLTQWLGLDPGSATSGNESWCGHDISGNPVRFSTKPLVVSEDDEWRTAMKPRDRRIVSWTTAPLMRRYGYRPLKDDASG